MGAEAIAAILAAIGGTATAATAAGMSHEQWVANTAMQDAYWQANQKINEQRFQQTRSDSLNAMQNKVRDLKAAGLSPVLAASGTGSPVASMSTAGGSPSPMSMDMSGVEEAGKMVAEAPGKIMAVMRQKADIAQTEQQTKLTKLQQLQTKSMADKIDADRIKSIMDAAETAHNINAAGPLSTKNRSYIGGTVQDFMNYVERSAKTTSDALTNHFEFLKNTAIDIKDRGWNLLKNIPIQGGDYKKNK